jgi:hypothetical protein
VAIEETVQRISNCDASALISQALLDLAFNLDKSVLDLTGSLRFVVTMTLIEASDSIVSRTAFDAFVKFLQERAFPLLNDKVFLDLDSLTIPRVC